MENEEITRKKKKLKELQELENEINKEISTCDGTINGCLSRIKEQQAKKQKLAKRISHNMRLRNKIISEFK
jgi:peptidoglycan hydrolase CwlO-like protein